MDIPCKGPFDQLPNMLKLGTRYELELDDLFCIPMGHYFVRERVARLLMGHSMDAFDNCLGLGRGVTAPVRTGLDAAMPAFGPPFLKSDHFCWQSRFGHDHLNQ